VPFIYLIGNFLRNKVFGQKALVPTYGIKYSLFWVFLEVLLNIISYYW